MITGSLDRAKVTEQQKENAISHRNVVTKIMVSDGQLIDQVSMQCIGSDHWTDKTL